MAEKLTSKNKQEEKNKEMLNDMAVQDNETQYEMIVETNT
jgi:hypothetical protein